MASSILRFSRLASIALPTIVGLNVGGSSANAQTAQQIAKNVLGSTVLLIMEDANGQTRSRGSGFFVRDGQIVSNLHVIEGATRGYAKLVGREEVHELEGVIAVDAEKDLVILKTAATGLPVLPLGNSDSVQIGEPVYAIGNPHGFEGTFSQGIVSGIREDDTGMLLQITAPVSPGSSGGPVLNGKGEVVGVSVFTITDAQNLNFAIPSKYVQHLLGKVGDVKPFAYMVKAEKSTKIQRKTTERPFNLYTMHKKISLWGLTSTWAATLVGALAMNDEFVGTTAIPVAGPFVTVVRIERDPNAYYRPGGKPLLIASGVVQTGFLIYFVASWAGEQSYHAKISVLPSSHLLGALMRYHF